MIPGARGRILVVDDEAAFAEFCCDVLQAAGYAATIASAGGAALTALESGAFDVVLSDIRMPGMTGIDLLRQVRERDFLVPVVLMTGDATVETAAKAVELGATQYLTKPFSEKDLLESIERSVRLRRALAARQDYLLSTGARDRLVWDRTGLEVRLDRALRSLRLDYQPILSAADGSVIGREALVRTTEDAFPNPPALLEAAARLGRLAEVGRRVRATVAEWQRARGPGLVFLNLHPQDLADPTLYDPGEPLTAWARHVVLELTERASLSDVTDVPGRIRVLKGLGYRIAIDDLGTGYSGLAAVAMLEPEFVKLDISLVGGCGQEGVKRTLIGALTAFCHATGIVVVAEGIETEAERSTVVAEGCDLLQGFLLGRPGPEA